MKKILHLCADIGSDSQPYRDTGYEVICIGKDTGVENFHPPKDVYGIIANPPCTHFSIARTRAKTPRDLREGMRLVKECLRIIWECQYAAQQISYGSAPLKFWCIENPATGFLKWFLGNPVFEYQPYEYGEEYSKRTALWGNFNLPKRPLLFMETKNNWSNSKGAKMSGEKRSICPINFAKAFFMENQ